MLGQFALVLWRTEPVDIGLRRVQRGRKLDVFLNDVVGLLRRRPCPDRNMRLAVLQPEQTRTPQKPHHQPRILGLKIGKNRRDEERHRRERRDHQFARNILAPPANPPHKLRELIVGCLRDLQQILAGLGCRVTPRMALKQLHAQFRFQCINVANDGRMVDPHDFGSTTHSSHLGHMKCGADFIPSANGHEFCAFF